VRPLLAYRPGRDPLHAASAPAASLFLFSFAVLAFVYEGPIVIGSVVLSACLIGFAARARRTVLLTLRWGIAVALLMTIVNALVTDRGETVLARLGTAPVLGQVNVTLESLVYGAGTLSLRLIATLLVFAVYSACVNPDELLRLLRPVARRSAMSASLVTRLVPVAAADLARLHEAAALRGPAAAPVGRGAMARRIVAGSLDRSIDVAATLELRGYSLPAVRGVRPPLKRSRHDRLFYALAALVAGAGIAAALAGFGGYDTYPRIVIDTDPATLVLAAALPLAAMAPFWIGRPRG
jgi:energy-coupling factor transport system permease protein